MSESTKKSIPIAPSMQTSLNSLHINKGRIYYNNRTIIITLIAIVLGIAAGFVAQILTALIGLITNLSFYGRFSFEFISPKYNTLGILVVAVPVVGGLIVGLMARYGSKGIRGHGIPEAMEQVLTNKSRIPPRLTFLKPISAAIAIGTGGPFGAEGPIIATGGAIGSVLGQFLPTNSDERKILLAAGAAGGMAATFGSPISAILLAIELLLFEFKPSSFLPVALASLSATTVRLLFDGFEPAFKIDALSFPTQAGLISYFGLGLIMGLAAIYITKFVYGIEDFFEKLPIHWMWWPAMGAVVVGIAGFFVPATLGVGYDNINNILNGKITGTALIILFFVKFISWSFSLGSGTSGGTLAPLFTIGGGLGASLGAGLLIILPQSGIDPRMAALVGMAAIFAGSSRAILTSIIFAFETTLQTSAILPLLACCSASYFTSLLFMKQTIMTEKIARRGVKVPNEYLADHLDQVNVEAFLTKKVIAVRGDDKLEDVRGWVTGSETKHHTFPVIDSNNKTIGIITRREILDLSEDEKTLIKNLISRPPVILFKNNSIREAADLMAEFEVYAIPIVENSDSLKLIGIISRSDVLKARKLKIDEQKSFERTLLFTRRKSK